MSSISNDHMKNHIKEKAERWHSQLKIQNGRSTESKVRLVGVL